jgi:hypothetical protein
LTQRFRVMSLRPPPRDCVMPKGTTQPRLAFHFGAPKLSKIDAGRHSSGRPRSEENGAAFPRERRRRLQKVQADRGSNRPGKNPAITYFRAMRTIMGPVCLTAVFGMGTGVSTRVWSPGISNGSGKSCFVCRALCPRGRATGGGSTRSSVRLLVRVS